MNENKCLLKVHGISHAGAHKVGSVCFYNENNLISNLTSHLNDENYALKANSWNVSFAEFLNILKIKLGDYLHPSVVKNYLNQRVNEPLCTCVC